MSILRTTYNSYLPELHKARIRNKANRRILKNKGNHESSKCNAKKEIERDNEIIRIINKMITKKKLINESQDKLNKLISDSYIRK